MTAPDSAPGRRPSRGRRARPVRGAARQLRGPLRPAAEPDQQAQARHHRGRALAGHRRVHRPRQGRGAGLGARADHVVPARGLDAARPQGGPAAAAGRRRGRGGPRAARGARPALRPADAVPRVQAGRRRPRQPAGRRVAAAPARRRAGGAVRHAAARGADRHRARAVRRAGGQGDGAQAGARGVAAAHPRRRRSASASRRRSWSTGCAAVGDDDLPGAVRGLARTR